jgi:hypothetical protein
VGELGENNKLFLRVICEVRLQTLQKRLYFNGVAGTFFRLALALQ